MIPSNSTIVAPADVSKKYDANNHRHTDIVEIIVADIHTPVKLLENVFAIFPGSTKNAHSKSAPNIFIDIAMKKARYNIYPISNILRDIHWLFAISGERITRKSFFQNTCHNITQITSIPMSRVISQYVIKRIFQKRKLKISSCIFPSNPTEKIPPARPIWDIISLLDSRDVIENFSIQWIHNTAKIAKIIPNT